MTTSHTAAAFTSAADVECLQCGAVSRAGTRFCTTCGAALRALACQTCAAINPYPAVFCAECGNPLDVALSKTGKTAGRRAFDATTAETVEAAAGAQWGVSAASPTDEELAPSLPGFLGWVKRAFGTPGTPEYRIMNLAMMVLIYFSVASIMLESVAEIHNAYAPLFEAAELVIVVAFTLEYAANIYAAPNKRAYILSFWGIIDLLAIIPSYLHLLDLRVLRITRSVRMLRVLRVLKLAKTMRTADTGQDSGRGILLHNLQLYLICTLCVVVISATLLFYAEGELDHTAFPHIPAAMWWALLTLASIGYESTQPVTGAGRAIAVFTMFSGLALYAMLVNVVGQGLRVLDALPFLPSGQGVGADERRTTLTVEKPTTGV